MLKCYGVVFMKYEFLEQTSLLNDQSTKSEEKKQLISCFVKRPIHDISIDESNDSEVTNELPSKVC